MNGKPAGPLARACAECVCFLLPATTGFIVVCRRDVWHGGDMAGAGRLRAQWNEALLQLVVAPAYLELLAAAAQLLGPSRVYDRLVLYNSFA